MIGKLTHFAIHVDDIDRASQFYESVFNWSFNGDKAADFLQIRPPESEESEIIGALQHRNYSSTSEKVIGFECSIAVEDVDKTREAVEKAGGAILMQKTEIPHVGWIIKFTDTEGNLVCAVQYHEHIR